VAGISYSVESTARAARAEAAAASTQLAALRAQLHPHFLFNSLHTVVQLIPVNPTLAMEAAELVAELLRASLEEQRDELPLADEWRFVSRYLAVERLRFGDRLEVREDLPPAALQANVPAFALQTLVENAVRHGAAPRVAATTVVITASGGGSGSLTLRVRNDREAASPAESGTGTGLARLRERLAVLYGNSATLTAGPVEGGYEAVLVIPQRRAPRAP
jgi:two-component system LytT family sensor kinase